MMESKRKRKTVGFVLIGVGIGLMIVLGILFFLPLRGELLQKGIERSVLRMDNEMQHIIDRGLNHSELDESETGLLVFMSDTLVYWNRNDVNPKLMKRKVEIGRDTICQLPGGSYYVKSYQTADMAYYVFRLISTSYQFENRYFENYISVYPRWIKADVSFIDSPDGQPVVNCEGELLAYCHLNAPPELRHAYLYLFLPLFLLVIVGLILVLTKPSDNEDDQNRKSGHVEIGVIVIFVISVLSTFFYYRVNLKRENERMVNLAAVLSEKRDERFEKSYAGFVELVKSDTDFRDMVFAESNVLSDVVLGYSKALLFDETMKAYNATLTLCEPYEEITIQPDGYVTDCDFYFLEKQANNKHERVGDGLYFMDYYTLDPNYLGQIKLFSADSLQQKTLYFEFYKPVAPEGFGFPQMLQEANSQKPYDYSVANFRDNLLVYKYGRYVYPNFLSNMKVKENAFSYGRRYKHYTVNNGENNVLIISTLRKTWSEVTAPFAVFFLGLLLPYLLIFWLVSPKKRRKWKDRTFRQRLQTILLMTLGISFLAIGPISIIYMRSLYNQRTAASQFETTQTLSNEMRNDLDFSTLLRTASRSTWDEILQHYSTTFFTDLNLYQLNGQLLATTRPEINELNLQAPVMNAEAYQNLHRNKALYFTHAEYLGKGVYESAYIPLTDANGNTLAYLNTPYFSSATDLHNEIMNFVLTYINIILILLAIALVVILSISRHLTEPLALIQTKMGDLKIGEKNEPIEWKANDEIGSLVKQYNNLIEELEKSAAELERRATESAWRGVARQVAHEIKNSLTPMRLSIQLLQRNFEKGNATPEQIQRTTTTLIEQIDALSDIASSFSSYAKLPENHPQPFDLAELVGNVVDLFDHEENITFEYIYDKAIDHTYNGDKTNLNSAVTNLIKNAVQAIGSKPDGRVVVTLKSTDASFVISVKDNGKGIKDEDKKKIFLPNFTTKNGGSGVGLSLTYNIVQTAGGSISFESREGEGAEFVIELPKTDSNPI